MGREVEDTYAGGFAYDVTRRGEEWMGGVFSCKNKTDADAVARVLNELEMQRGV